MNSDDQAIPTSDWRQLLRKMRTLAGLRALKPDHGALAPLDAEDLAAAAENPDHSEAGRAAAMEAARDRGLGLLRWRLKVPGFIDTADLARGELLFFGWGRAVRVWSGRAIFAYFALILVSAALTPGQAPMTTETRFWIDVAGMRFDSDDVFAVLGLAGLSVMAIWFFASAFRRRPARVLLLRKFNVRALSVPLERMMARELRPYGHIASLSDKYVRHDNWGWLSMAMLSISNPLAAIWFVIGAPVRFIWRLFDRSRMGPVTVLSARDYRSLARRLRDRIGLNVQIAVGAKEAFLIRTSDAWWRIVVRLLMDSSDAILVDLSQISEGTAWELEVIREQETAARCVFVSLWGKAEEAQSALARLGLPNTCFHYAPDGEIQRRAEFRSAMLAAMRATYAP
ncbi:MAG: hypothetical protein ABL864_12045 [Terricaulis sp.]